ncbi:FxsA family protein [Chitinibacter sp. S2-10]|uniref:FxsA family protein n=1 Tax=Chitinibacter sp. S2-10 TaxID=3373597 RepID=UPI0039778BE5
MPYLIFASILAYPVLEMMSLFWLADAIGSLATLLIVLLSFAVGVLMLRHQRLAIGLTLMSDLRTGRLGINSLMSVARYYIAALLFIIPGVIGDVIGLILLLPWWTSTAARSGSTPVQDGVIDGEYRRVDPQNAADATNTPPRIDR